MPQRIKPFIASLILPVMLVGAPGSLRAQTLPVEVQLRGGASSNDLLGDPEQEDIERLDPAAPGEPSRQRDGLRGTIDADPDAAGDTTSAVTNEALRDIAETEALEPLEIGKDAELEQQQEVDLYAANGIRLGSFLLFPELSVESVYMDNVFLSPTQPEGDWALALKPALKVQSDWNRHSLEANIGGERSFHERFSTEDDNAFIATVAGRLDIRRDTNIVASAGYAKAQEDRGSNDFPSNAADRAEVRNRDWSLEGNHTLNRVTLTLRGEVSGEEYGASTAADGSTIDNSQRDYTEQRLTSRVAYEFQPGVQAFVEGSINDRVFDRRIDDNGQLSGSSGHDIQAGLAFRLTGKLTGEASAGYALQIPDDPTLHDVDGLIFNAALEYAATALTTLRFNAVSEVAETTEVGSAGSIERTLEVSVEHKPRRNIILGASLAYSNEQYSGTNETDEEWTTGLTGEYLLSPSVGLTASFEHVESISSTPGSDYSTDEVRMGIRFRR